MFEWVRIRLAAARSVEQLELPKADRDYIYGAVAHSPFMAAAVAGLKCRAMDSPHVAVAYLCTAIVDAVARSDCEEDQHRGKLAEAAAYAAMAKAGASEHEAEVVIRDLVAMHGRTAEKGMLSTLGQPQDHSGDADLSES